jgi:TonB family protein
LLLLALAVPPQAPSNEPPSEPRTVGGRIKEPRKIKSVPPKYPDDAKRAGIAGVVILECTISPKGEVAAVKVLKGLPLLSEAAVEAVRKWRYTPTLLDGVAVPVIMTVTVNFKLEAVRLEDLMDSLDHEHEGVREAAALGLRRLKTSGFTGRPEMRDAIRALERMAAKDESPSVRSAAEQTLRELDPRPAPSDDSPSNAEAPPEARPEAEKEPEPDSPKAEPASPAPDGASLEFDSPPRVIKGVRPQYPQAAFVAKIEGTVLIEALVDVDGRVSKARVIQSVPGLDEAALEAARRWRFEPARKGGKPVVTIIHMPVAFRIYDKEPLPPPPPKP